MRTLEVKPTEENTAEAVKLLTDDTQGSQDPAPLPQQSMPRVAGQRKLITVILSCALVLGSFVIFAALIKPPRTQRAKLRSAMRDFATPAHVDKQATAAMQSHVCADTPKWTDGDFYCKTSGYQGPHCTSTGYTCEAYAYNGWCYMGSMVQAEKRGFGNNNPELHCCSCGGGSKGRNESRAAGMNSTACSAYTGCAGLAGDCCPSKDGMLDCCQSAPVCEDAPEWANGVTSCQQDEYMTAKMGCAPAGFTCAGYVYHGWCKDGEVTKGKENFTGAAFNFPEVHCCACGRGKPQVSGKTVWLQALRDKEVDDATLTTKEAREAATKAAEGVQDASEAVQANVDQAAKKVNQGLP